MAKKRKTTSDLESIYRHLFESLEALQTLLDDVKGPKRSAVRRDAEIAFLRGLLIELTKKMAGRGRKGRGTAVRDAIIVKLSREGLTDGRIMNHPEVMAANRGSTMTRAAVGKVRRIKAGIVKKRHSNFEQS